MNSLNLQILGKHFHKLGLNITCISNYRNEFNLIDKNLLKSPNHEWLSLQSRRQTVEEFNSYEWEKAKGIGTVLGFNNLMAIDLDGCLEFDFILFILKKLEIESNYEWIIKSGSGAGFHIIFYCHDRPNLEDNYSYGIPILGEFLTNDIGINAYYPKPPDFYLNTEEENKTTFYSSDDNIISNFHLPDLFQKIEFRWINHLVLPTSIHASGLQYEFVNTLPSTSPIQITYVKLYHLFNEICLENARSSAWPGSFIAREDDKTLYQATLDYNAKYIPRYLVFDIIPNIDLDSEKVDWHSEIIQISWHIVDSHHNIINSGNFILKPDNYKISLVCVRKFGITDDVAEQIGYDYKYAFDLFIKEIFSVSYIVCHDYDMKSKIICNAFQKYGFNFNVFIDKPYVCTKKLSDYYSKMSNFKNIKIENLYSWIFKRELVVKHNAYVDSLITKICYTNLKDRFNLDDDKIISDHIKPF